MTNLAYRIAEFAIEQSGAFHVYLVG
jgi:hypothetical protein